VKPRNLQQEVKELEESQNIAILDITTIGGVPSRPVLESTIDSVKKTLEEINLDDIAKSVTRDIKAFIEYA